MTAACRPRRVIAAVFLAAIAAVSCDNSSAKPADKGSGNGANFTNRPGQNGPNGGVTTSTGSNDQGNSGGK